MTTWLRLIPIELQDVTTCVEIKGKAPEGSTAVGDLPMELLKLYTLWMNMAKHYDQTALDLKWDSENEELKAKQDEYQDKANALYLLLFISVKDHFGLWGKRIGFVEGNKVVILPPREYPEPPPFLRQLFGL
jgi:hypothetical protein